MDDVAWGMVVRVYRPTELMKAKGSSGGPRRWKDGKLHQRIGGKWVVVSEGKPKPEELTEKRNLPRGYRAEDVKVIQTTSGQWQAKYKGRIYAAFENYFEATDWVRKQ